MRPDDARLKLDLPSGGVGQSFREAVMGRLVRHAWILLLVFVLTSGCEECPPDLSADLARVTEENAALKAELAALRETPSVKLKTSAEEAARARDAQDLDALNTVIPQLRELLEMYPEDSEAHAASMVLESAVEKSETLQRRVDARREIDDAIASQDYRGAKRSIKTNSTWFSEEEVEQLNKLVYDAEFAPVEITVKQLEYMGQDYVGKRVKMTCLFRGLQDAWITELPGVKGTWHSPEGLLWSFNQSNAKKWMGFMLGTSVFASDSVLYQRGFALKSLHGETLMNLSDGQEVTVVGQVKDFGMNNWTAFMLDEISH